MKRKTSGDPEPIRLGAGGGPLGPVSAEKMAEWIKRAERFHANPGEKTKAAIILANLTLIRLDDVMRTTASPKVVQDCARIAKDYIAFAFRETKE